MNALKVAFLISTIAAMLTNVALISVGIYEILRDQEHEKTDVGPRVEEFQLTHLFISLLMFSTCNIFIFLHVIYITQYVLRNRRYHWHLSCHYFTYIVWEIISVCCIFSKYDYLEYALLLHFLTGLLFVLLFFFNCWAVRLFDRLEQKIIDAEEQKVLKKIRPKRRKGACVRISLRGENINVGASTSAKKEREMSLDF